MANRNLASVPIFCALIIKISEQYPPATSTNMEKHNYLGGKSDLGLPQLSTMRQSRVLCWEIGFYMGYI